MTNIPKSPLEVLNTIETQTNECEDCGTSTSDWVICPKCTRKVCTNHIDSTRGICTTCKTDLDTENKDYHAKIELAESQRLAEIENAKSEA